MHPRAPLPPESMPVLDRSQQGFVLVGVIMFVLALTILGISLFGLSGYEAQFLGHSHTQSQLFYDGLSGIERTKYVLASSDSMAVASYDGSSAPPLEGLESLKYARAIQGTDSTGAVDWDITNPNGQVRIWVVVERGGERMVLEASFLPQSDQSLYRDLIATTGRIAVNHDAAAEQSNIVACGRIHNLDRNDWWGEILGAVEHLGGVPPVPEVQDFINAWQPPPSSPTLVIDHSSIPAIHSYSFNLGGNPFRVFKGPSNPRFGFGLWDREDDDITFDFDLGPGTAVWLLPAGAYFEQPVTITGDDSNNLIIVAGKSTDTTFSAITGADPGLWFQGGISSFGPNLFLVSNGTVALDRWQGISHETRIPFLSVFSGGVYLRGPRGGPGYVRTFEITHCGNDDAILDPLYDKGLLPNTLGRTKSFALVPGSFQEITDSNPSN